MKAVLNGSDGHLHWSEVENPTIKSDQVLLKIYAAGLNRADLLQRAGNYPPPSGWPDWFGLEAAGEIVDLGEDVKAAGKWKIGDRVCALLGGGGYAEYAAVPAGMLMPIPSGLDWTQAAAIPEAFGAAYLFLFWEGKLKAGDTLLVTAGASGLASVLIPMAKAFGARVLTTVLNDGQEHSIKHLNADLIINTSRTSVAEIMKSELDAGRPVDIAIDCLGGEAVGECLPLMNRGGRWIIIATLAADITSVDLRAMYVRGIKLMGTTLRSRTTEEKTALLVEMTELLWGKVEKGEIRPTIHKIFPIEQAEEAQALMESGKSAGKIILTVNTH